jgi:uncharacterized protein (TIGR03086 family)
LFHRSVDEFDRRMKTVGESDWGNPTPCAEWDVRALVNHLVNESVWVKPLLDGKTIAEVGDEFDGDLLGEDPQAVWERASNEARTAFAAPGVIERTVHLSYGDRPAQEYLGQLTMDYVIHSWDLARGTGADDTIDPQLVEEIYELAAPAEDLLKAAGVYGDKVVPPEGADRQTELLAIFGRRP